MEALYQLSYIPSQTTKKESSAAHGFALNYPQPGEGNIWALKVVGEARVELALFTTRDRFYRPAQHKADSCVTPEKSIPGKTDRFRDRIKQIVIGLKIG